MCTAEGERGGGLGKVEMQRTAGWCKDAHQVVAGPLVLFLARTVALAAAVLAVVVGADVPVRRGDGQMRRANVARLLGSGRTDPF